jgi:Na+-driven multidrug efflux pump
MCVYNWKAFFLQGSLLKKITLAIVNFYNDREYFRLIVKFAFPIALQSLVMSSLNMVALMMIGQLGETSVAAVGLANQIWFLLNLVIFGGGARRVPA